MLFMNFDNFDYIIFFTPSKHTIRSFWLRMSDFFTPLLYQLFSLHLCSLASRAISEANSTSLCQKLVALGVRLVSFREVSDDRQDREFC